MPKGHGIFGISFTLTQCLPTPFYVNSVNFSAVRTNNATAASLPQKFVSQSFVSINNETFPRFITSPSADHSFDADYGVLVDQNVQAVTGKIVSWNQSGKWRTYTHDYKYAVKYPMTPRKLPQSSPPQYQGYGFWVCGGAPTSKSKVYRHHVAYYRDKVNM